MRVFLAPDTSDHPNWGCRAMGAWFRAALPRAGASKVISAGSQWFYRRHAELPDLSSLAQFRRYAAHIRDGKILPRLSATLRDCDLVCLNGENFVRPGAHKGRNLLFLAYIAKTVFEKPCVLANHSVELAEPGLEDLVREIYPMLDEVQFREQTSVEQAARFVSPRRWRLIPDVAWTIRAAQGVAGVNATPATGPVPGWATALSGFKPDQPYITVCASSLFSLPQYRNVEIAPAFAELCRHLDRQVAAVVLLAPDECDQRIMRRVRAASHFPLLELHAPVQLAIDVIANGVAHVGGRWHAGIFATLGGTPWVALGANNHKVHSLTRQIGMDDPVFDALTLGRHIDDVIALVRAKVARGQVLRTQLKRRARELAARVTGTLEIVQRHNVRRCDAGGMARQASGGVLCDSRLPGTG